MKKGKLGAILLALVLIIGLVCCVVCLEKIPAGYVGVVYNMNGGTGLASGCSDQKGDQVFYRY